MKQRPPNILLIVSDQQRPDLLGCLGRLPVRTPHLDGLAAEGTLFRRAYTPCPLCTPARASLLTGQYPSRHGAWSIGTDTPHDALSLPALLKVKAGYRTGIIGKSHLRSCLRPGSPEALPKSRDWSHWDSWSGPWFGFDHARISVGHVQEPHTYSMHYGAWLRKRGIPAEPPYFERIEDRISSNHVVGRWDLPEEHHYNAWILEECRTFFERAEGEAPFYLSVNFPDPHVPFRVPAPWDTLHDDVDLPEPRRDFAELKLMPTIARATIENRLGELGWHEHAGIASHATARTDRSRIGWSEEETACWRHYFGMQALLDKYVGLLLGELTSRGMADNTLVVYTSDHGELMGDHWLQYKGGSHYWQAVGVPLLARWPGRIPAGVRQDSLQSLVDLPATFLSAAGSSPHPLMQGTDQLKSWLGEAPSPREGVWIDHRVEKGITVDTWITQRWRLSVHLIEAENRIEWELYDLVADPDELRNLGSDPAHADKRAELLAQLNLYKVRHAGPWLPRPTFA
jgi:arylsulfatase A-like enzyme